MNEEMVTTDEISLADIFKALLKKIKTLILVLLIGVIAGGAFGYFTNVNKKYYGTDLEFYVNPKETVSSETESTYGVYGAYGVNVMNTIVNLLNSEMFAERLMEGMDTPEKFVSGNKVNPAYARYLKEVVRATTFSFTKEGEEIIDDANNLAKSFIYVNISVLGEEKVEFAEKLLDQVKIQVPVFVEENMIVPTGYKETDCKEITVLSEIGRINEGNEISAAITYGAILGLVALLVACVVVVLIDRSDKRVRDYESVFRKLGVPVLGVVPAIAETEKKDKTEKTDKTEKEAE